MDMGIQQTWRQVTPTGVNNMGVLTNRMRGIISNVGDAFTLYGDVDVGDELA
jgi:hypothetical protein